MCKRPKSRSRFRSDKTDSVIESGPFTLRPNISGEGFPSEGLKRAFVRLHSLPTRPACSCVRGDERFHEAIPAMAGILRE